MAAPTARKRTHCFTNQDPISILAGPEPKTFKLYPSLLTNNSKVFQKALSEAWQQQSTQNSALNFTFLDVDTFNHYINWCHLGDLDILARDIDTDGRCVQLCHVLAQMYVLADVLDDKVLRNAAMDKILECAATRNYRPGDGTIHLAFSNLPETSTLCRFMIDDGLSGIDVEWLKQQQGSLPKEYLDALLFGWAERAVDKSLVFHKPADYVRCMYHEHDGEVVERESCGQSAAVKETPVKTSPTKFAPKRKRG